MNIFKQITANNISLKNYPFIKELAMEAYLIENENILKLDENDFSEVSILDAEIALKKGRANKDGRIDILAKYGSEYLAIVELKLNEINEESLSQLENYLDQREQLLTISNDYWDIDNELIPPKWIGVLIGSSINADIQKKLLEGYKYKGIPIACLTLKRFRTDTNEILVISDTFFQFKYSTKDYSKFIFNKKEYNKSKLVNSVIKYYIECNPNTSFSELKQKFPDSIQGSYGVFDTKEKAQNIYDKTNHKRYYINPNEIITLSNEEISTCTQWNISSIKKFLEYSRKLGLKIDIY